MKKEGKMLIITCDDERDIRESVRDVLTDDGFEVITAWDGRDLLNKLKTVKPDLILLDVIMPGLITKDILLEMHKRKLHIPIILLTVVRLAEQSKQIIGNSVVDYIEKPFENKDLVKRVRKALR
jgi:DNA-binding response OmpR family regulator